MKKDRYFEGLLAAGRDCINHGDGMDFPAGLIGDAENDYQRGERFAYRAFRDYEEVDAIDIITARLWKWGAEEELDRFLAFIGMDDEDDDDELTLDEFIATVHREMSAEPVPVADRPSLADFILSARGGHIYFGPGYEFTPAELIELLAQLFR